VLADGEYLQRRDGIPLLGVVASFVLMHTQLLEERSDMLQ
jgi:hypothetical protein